MKTVLLAFALASALSAQLIGTDPNAVVLKVNGKDITAADVKKILDSADSSWLQAYQQNPQQALSDYFALHDLNDIAVQRKIPEQSPFKEQLQFITMTIVGRAMVDFERNTYSVSLDDVKTYYDAHTSDYEQAKIKLIYLPFTGNVTGGDATTQAGATEILKAQMAHDAAKKTEEQQRTLAQDLVKQLRAGGNFAKLAQQYSEDDSKATGGDFGFVKLGGVFPPDFIKAVLDLKPGEIGEPIRQPAAYYVIQVVERSAQPINDVTNSISDTLRNAHMNEFFHQVVERNQIKVVDPDFFKPKQQPGLPGLTVIPGAK